MWFVSTWKIDAYELQETHYSDLIIERTEKRGVETRVSLPWKEIGVRKLVCVKSHKHPIHWSTLRVVFAWYLDVTSWFRSVCNSYWIVHLEVFGWTSKNIYTPTGKFFRIHFFRCKMVSLERLMVFTLAPLPLKMSWASNRPWVFGTPWALPKRMTPCLFVAGAMWKWSMDVWQCSHAWDTLCPWQQVSWKRNKTKSCIKWYCWWFRNPARKPTWDVNKTL